MAAYLFVHFIGEQKDGEQIYFSVSRDGLHWTDLNEGRPVLKSTIGTKGVRDPFVVKHPDTGKYYLIATDLRIEAGLGWEAAQYHASRDLIVWESADLVNWSGPRACTVGIEGAGCVWAPEAVYDRQKDSFFVFWASMTRKPGEAEGRQRIYAAWTKDFREFTEPFLYIEKQQHVIDTTIIENGGRFYRISKDETSKCLILEACDTLTGEFREIHSDTLSKLFGVEGPECYPLPDGKSWCLIADRFAEGKGYLPMRVTDWESGRITILEESEYDFGRTKKRHGGVLPITDEAYEALVKHTFADAVE